DAEPLRVRATSAVVSITVPPSDQPSRVEVTYAPQSRRLRDTISLISLAVAPAASHHRLRSFLPLMLDCAPLSTKWRGVGGEVSFCFSPLPEVEEGSGVRFAFPLAPFTSEGLHISLPFPSLFCK